MKNQNDDTSYWTSFFKGKMVFDTWALPNNFHFYLKWNIYVVRNSPHILIITFVVEFFTIYKTARDIFCSWQDLQDYNFFNPGTQEQDILLVHAVSTHKFSFCKIWNIKFRLFRQLSPWNCQFYGWILVIFPKPHFS